MKPQILLVDDEPGIRTVLSVFLADLGYDVLTAADSTLALDLFADHSPPIVIADIKMAGMDGIELLRHIKGIDPHTEVIMITGHGDMDLAIESLKLDAADFITKPINSDVLEIALKRAQEKIELRESLDRHTAHLEDLVQETSAKLVAAERQAVVGQVVEGLMGALGNLAQTPAAVMSVFDDLPLLVSVHDRHLTIIATNAFFKQQLGDLKGARSWRIYPSVNLDAHTCPVALTIAQNQSVSFRAEIEMDRGLQSVSVFTAPIRDKTGRIEMVLEIATNLETPRQLEDELRTTRRRYQELFDAVPCYITVQDRDLNLVEANQRFKRDFGNPSEPFCYEAYKQLSGPCDDCPVLKSFGDGTSHQAEMVVQPREQDEMHLLVWTAPIRDAEGNVTHVMEMATDITRVHKLQKRLASLGLMISKVSHGIKGLLTGLDGGLYFMDAGLSSGQQEDIVEGRGMIRTTTDRIKTMVLDILYYAKERPLAFDEVLLEEFFSDLTKNVQTKIEGRSISLKAEIQSSLKTFEADPEALHSALVNILDNAVDACLADHSKPAHQITLRVQSTETGVQIEIIDDGTGLDDESQQRMFDLFYSSKGKQGTGLGLTISKQIVEQHGGWIEVSSHTGQGTHLTLILPQNKP